jgi:creatinine amidohydrolase
MAGINLAEVTWQDAAKLLRGGRLVVLPIGGGVKEHGGHLPLGTDMMVTGELARRLLEATDVLMLPLLPYAYFPAFVDWPGSVSVEADHFKNLVGDILRSYARHGAKRFLVLDGGVSTHYPLTILSYDLHNELGVEVAVTDVRGLGAEVSRAICEQERGGHADESETSCLLALRPDLVHLDRARKEFASELPAVRGPTGISKITLKSKMDSARGANGDPTLATEAKGRQILDAMAADVIAFALAFGARPTGDRSRPGSKHPAARARQARPAVKRR